MKTLSAEEAAKLYCDVQVGDKAKLISDRSVDSWNDSYDSFIAGFKSASLQNKELQEENERLRAEFKSHEEFNTTETNVLKSQVQSLTSQRDKYLEGLKKAVANMNRCRDILTTGSGGNWGMLDTTNLQSLITESEK